MKNAIRGSIFFALLFPVSLLVQGQLPGQLPGQKAGGQLPGPSSLPSKPATTPPPATTSALPTRPCCAITALNKATGVVTAREKSGQRTIEIKVSAAQMQNLRVGQDIFANLDTKKASLDGKTLCCDLVFAAAAPPQLGSNASESKASGTSVAKSGRYASNTPTTASPHQVPSPTATPTPTPTPTPSALPSKTAAGSLLGGATGTIAAPHDAKTPAKAAAVPEAPCCSIAKIDTATAMVTAKEKVGAKITAAKGRESSFEFHVADAKQLQGLRTGQNVFANLESGDVSLDGKTMCCKIKGAGLHANAAIGGPRIPAKATVLPTATAGAVQMVGAGGRANIRTGLGAGPGMLHLEGVDAIKSAPGLHQSAKDLLLMHARTLPEHELDNYVVDPKAAAAWFAAHPAPASVAKAASDSGKKKKKKGCNYTNMSMKCASNEVSNAVDDVTQVWRKAWSDTTAEVMRDWNMATDCFADHTLNPLNVPIKFKETIPVPVPSVGVAKVTLGVPMDVDVTAHVKLFYIPCLPFAIRPKTLGAEGTMESGGTITATVNVTQPIKHKFTVAALQVPIAVVPIVIGGVPIAVLDVSVYADGTLDINAKGKLNGKVKLESLQKIKFEFECSGHGCNVTSRTIPIPATAMESVKLDGRLTLTPAIYTALQLSLNGPLFQVRAGPQPELIGELYGCGAASGSQNTSGVTSGTSSYALTGDLDWTIELRAEALSGMKKLADRYLPLIGKPQHLGFWDLAQSTGLIPVVSGNTQLASGKPTAYMITMPECYPFRESADNVMQYRVSWDGQATPSVSASPHAGTGCTFQTAEGICHGAPTKQTAFNLSWPAAGDYTVTVAPVNDPHGHKFEASRAKQYKVRVGS